MMSSSSPDKDEKASPIANSDEGWDSISDDGWGMIFECLRDTSLSSDPDIPPGVTMESGKGQFECEATLPGASYDRGIQSSVVCESAASIGKSLNSADSMVPHTATAASNVASKPVIAKSTAKPKKKRIRVPRYDFKKKKSDLIALMMLYRERGLHQSRHHTPTA
jgi:hypothetical protein